MNFVLREYSTYINKVMLGTKKVLIIALMGVMVHTEHLFSQSTHYDFDSLLQSNPQFKPLMKMVMDTFQIFGPEEPLEFTVATDMRALSKNKHKDEYQEAQVIYHLWDSINISREIRIKPRGVFRLDNCSNPPLWVNVKKTEEVFELLDGLKKMKLVIPCRGQSQYQGFIFTEYLAYKLYNVITDYSFKVRLIKVNYHDTGGKVKPGSAYTFIMESEKALAKRKESIPIKNERISAKSLDEEYSAIVYIFQYMIGNTDWSVPGLHNMKLLKTTDVTRPKPIPVTYDFDYCGLVDAPYAIPGTHVDIESVRERTYMGYCLPDELMEKAFDLFIEKESEVMAVISDFSLMTDKSKKKPLSYMKEFYDIIKDPKRRDRRIVKKCL